MYKKKIISILCLTMITILIAGCTNNKENETAKKILKLGYFPNITHSQALVGIANGKFQEVSGQDVEIKTQTFSSGTSEIEALFAGEIDLGYIGPTPATNGYIQSNGEALRIISGANSGGALLVAQPELAKDFKQKGAGALKGKKIASPSLGNTQDNSLRHYLNENNLIDEVEIIPTKNADQLTMFSQKELDGCWVPEPWGTRLIKEAGAELLIDERDLWPNNMFTTTNVIVSKKFLDENRDIIKKWIIAHVELTNWINTNPEEAQKIVNSEIERLTTQKLNDDILSESWEKIDVTVDPVKDSVLTFAEWSYENGFLGEDEPNLSNLYDLSILNEVTNKEYK